MINQEEIKIRLGVDNSAVGPGMQEARRHIESGAEGVKIFNVHGKEMHKLIHLLDESAPGLGMVLKGIFNPSTIGIGLIVVGIQRLMGWMETAKEKTKEFVNQQVEDVMRLEKVNDDLKKERESAQTRFEKAMQAGEESITSTLKSEADKRMALLDAEIQQYRKLIDIQEARALSEAKGDATAEAAVKKRYDALRAEFDQQSAIEKLEVRRQELDNLKDAGRQIRRHLYSLQLEQGGLLNDQRVTPLRVAVSEEAEKKLLAAQVAARKALDDETKLRQQFPIFDPLQYQAEQKLMAKLHEELAVRDAAVEEYKKNKAFLEAHDSELKALNEQIENTAKQYQENQRTVRDLSSQIEQTQKIAAISQQKSINAKTTLGADIVAMQSPTSPSLKQFLELRQKLLSGRLSGQDAMIFGDEARREFNALPLADKIKAMQTQNLPKQLRTETSTAALEKLLHLAETQGIKVLLPEDNSP